jgi:hypothetical protein
MLLVCVTCIYLLIFLSCIILLSQFHTRTVCSQYSNMPTPSPQNYSQNPAPTPSSSRRSHLSSVSSTPMSRGDISRGIHRIVNHASMSSSSGGGDNNFSITGTPQTPNIRNRNRNNDSNSDGNFSDHSSIRTPGGGANGILVHSTPHIPFDFDRSTPATPNGSTTWESDAGDASQGHEEVSKYQLSSLYIYIYIYNIVCIKIWIFFFILSFIIPVCQT